MVQFGGINKDEVDAAAQRMLDALHETEHDPSVEFFDDPGARTSCGRPGRPGSARPRMCPASPTPSKAGRTRQCRPRGWVMTSVTCWRCMTSSGSQ